MSEIELEISPRILGRADGPVVHAFVRALREEDIGLLDAPRPTAKPQGNAIKRLGDRHHALARYIAQGYKPAEAAFLSTYAVATVHSLLANPAFKELVEWYRSGETRDMRTNFARLIGLSADASDVLQDRLEGAPEEISTPQLIEIIKLGNDRTGNGPVSGNVTVSINANIADKMKKARELARAAADTQDLELTAIEVTRSETVSANES
jgi:hypothetical protein